MVENSSNSEKLNSTQKEKKKYINYNQILNTIYNEEINQIDSEIEIKANKNISIEPKMIYDKFSKDLKIEFKIGNKKMYKIKDLSEFYTRIIERKTYKYGSKLEFVHIPEIFSEESKDIFKFLMKYAEIIKYANTNTNTNYRYYGKALNESYITLTNTAIDEFFEVMKNKSINLQKDNTETNIEFTEENPNMYFSLKEENEEYKIQPEFDIYKVVLINGRKYKYILTDEKFYRCSLDFENSTLRLLNIMKKNYITKVIFGKEQLNSLFSVIMPKIRAAVRIEDKLEKKLESYIPKDLGVKVFLDLDSKGYIIAKVIFCYGEYEFNPLKEEKQSISRNIIEESKVLNIFRKTGFMLDIKNYRFILPDEDKIYEFLANEIEYYMEEFEVLVTDNFKSKEIVKPKISSIGVKVENNLLSIDLEDLNMSTEEMIEMLEKYKKKKRYFRLRNGNFIELKENKEIDFLDKLINGLDIQYKELSDGKIKLPVNRILYLNQLLETVNNTEVIKDDKYRKITDDMSEKDYEKIAVPEVLNLILRPYQKNGFKWLSLLDKYKFGGILADDMGLGKTIQILSLLLNYKENNNKPRTSIVICPSSLTLNWQNEIKKFTTELNIKVISGTANERKSIIRNLEESDLIITSYDLLKRDIETYEEKDYQFKYVIADEAQYLKNSNTQNAKTIKIIKAENRFALTGTPIENSLAELWSIFDFVMPGYLFSYKKFKSNYEMPIVRNLDENAMEKLKMLIEPFVLRRTKTEVLTELPEKTVTVLNNEMKEEQRKIYLSYLMQAKQEIKEEIDVKGYERSQIKILAALTRLRQICCHPSLFVDEYTESSSKLEQCMEIIEDGINAEHKILLFSSYTSMFDIIEKELKIRKINYYKLTGSTKVNERIELVDNFNKDKNIKVFLISLKAGGTGLNLTGADMVIHYDPWWNISAENQATDRAYRIGQKNNVQVYKLITKDSIEEKIYELQQKKEKLTNDMLDMKTTFINKLSKEDIMKLFD